MLHESFDSDRTRRSAIEAELPRFKFLDTDKGLSRPFHTMCYHGQKLLAGSNDKVFVFSDVFSDDTRHGMLLPMAHETTLHNRATKAGLCCPSPVLTSQQSFVNANQAMNQ